MYVKRTPKRAKNVTAKMALEVLNTRLVKMRTSVIGAEARSSHQMNTARSAVALTISTSVTGDDHPRRLAWVRASTIKASPPADNRSPGMSNEPFVIPLAGGTRETVAAITPATSGTFIQKTLPQLKCSSSTPPATGPIAIPSPAVADQIPIARPLSCGANIETTSDSVAGMTSAAAAPITVLQPISCNDV